MIDYKADEKVKKWIEKNKIDIVAKWIELSKIPSVEAEAGEDAPFGIESKRALDYCFDMFSEAGFETDRNGGYYIKSYHGEGKRSIGIFAHSDVVPAGDDWLFTEPFEPVIKENTLIGRGVSDNKSGVMAAFSVMRIFKEMDIPLSSSILAYTGACEEKGMKDLRVYIKEEKQPDFCFVPDSRFPCCIGEKGFYEFYVKSSCKAKDILNLKSGVANNVVSDYAVMTFAKNDNLAAELIEKGKTAKDIEISVNKTITVAAKGLSAHAATPSKGINAMYILSEFVSKLDNISEIDRELMKNTAFLLSDTTGENIGINISDERFGALTFSNGLSYLEDGYVVLGFNIRYGNSKPDSWLEEKIDSEINKLNWTTFKKFNRIPLVIEKDSDIPNMLADIYNEMSGVREEQPFSIGGKTYASLLDNAIAVGTCVGKTPDGFIPGMQMPKGHGGAHSPDEKIEIDAFFNAVRVLVQYIIAVDKKENILIQKNI